MYSRCISRWPKHHQDIQCIVAETPASSLAITLLVTTRPHDPQILEDSLAESSRMTSNIYRTMITHILPCLPLVGHGPREWGYRYCLQNDLSLLDDLHLSM